MTTTLKAPFPWFGGKSRVAVPLWERFGNVVNYVEPFFGSGAILLGRPGGASGIETINDKDGFVCNFWRALQHAPEAVAMHADYPVNENDLHARHAWLVANCGGLAARLEGHPEYFDAKIAGWWVWGQSAWIGSGWCSGTGPWRVCDGELIKQSGAGRGINRQLPHLGDAGRGINRKLPHLGGAGRGINRQLPHLGGAGQGINRKLPHLGGAGQGEMLLELATRMRRVRVCCGDWSRVMGPTVTIHNGVTGVFLDPPYSAEAERADVYSQEDDSVAHAVSAWARENEDNPLLRIALCGYEGEHDMPGWDCFAWKAHGGYGSQGNGAGRANCGRERIWFSPHTLGAREMELDFGACG